MTPLSLAFVEKRVKRYGPFIISLHLKLAASLVCVGAAVEREALKGRGLQKGRAREGKAPEGGREEGAKGEGVRRGRAPEGRVPEGGGRRAWWVAPDKESCIARYCSRSHLVGPCDRFISVSP